MEYYAKSANPQGYQEPLKHHLQKVSELAQEFGKPLGLDTVGALAGQMHDFGKYSQAFQDVLRGTRTGIDHAMAGACLLERLYRGRAGSRPVIEAVNGHHDGLLAYDVIRSELRAIAAKDETAYGNGGKTPSIESGEQLTEACTAFRQDFPEFRPPKQLPAPPTAELESMLYTRMLFSCLVDADYTASALNDDGTYLAHAEDSFFDPALLLEKLYAYRDDIKRNSKSDQTLNAYRDQVFDRCGEMGDAAEGLFTLTAPTGTGKTLALLHFALRHCLKHGKRRIIIVLPFLTLAEQSADTYANIIPNILTDHSQSHLPEDARELAARWSAPVIITTSVRFFEALFSDRPTVCRKLHNIADSVVLFDEAQSLPASLTSSTLRGVNELCRRYHTTIVFSTATQPDFSARKDVDWHPTEILPEHKALFAALQRVNVAWRLGEETPLESIAAEMSEHESVCAIVNLRRHARSIVQELKRRCPAETVFFLTTDLCPAHGASRSRSSGSAWSTSCPAGWWPLSASKRGWTWTFRQCTGPWLPWRPSSRLPGAATEMGGAMGRVIVFRPADERMPYPDDWYNNAAVTVQEMAPPFSIHDPETIREYYRRLFDGAVDKPELRKAIEARSFPQAAAQYHLIQNAGAQVIVPYPREKAEQKGQKEQKQYGEIAQQLRADGVTGALLHEAASITVTCFAKNLAAYAEEIPFAQHRKGKRREQTGGSNIYLLRPQYEDLYDPVLGLHFPQEEQSNYIW